MLGANDDVTMLDRRGCAAAEVRERREEKTERGWANRIVHAQWGKMPLRGDAAAEGLRREKKEKHKGVTQGKEMQSWFTDLVLFFVIEIWF